MNSAIFADNRTQQLAVILGLQSDDNNWLAVFSPIKSRVWSSTGPAIDSSPSGLRQYFNGNQQT